ncbi:MAG: hypothetical protein II998_04320 [Clostridia bacterium]|nr:hypothetical protein [Clostridia bacterium]
MENIIDLCMGMNIADRLAGSAKNVFVSLMDYVHVAFGDNVDYERLADVILYCPETRDYLYNTPPHETRYINGSRPELEKIVEEITKNCSCDREKVIAFMVFIRDLRKKSYGYDFFFGGTEEELIKKGERYCERVVRIMSAFCEISSIPCRTILHVSGGHHTCEVYIDGKWGFIDPRFALFYISSDGNLMSLEEIVENPDVIYKQPSWVYEYASDEADIEFMCNQNRDVYMRKSEIQCYGVYSLADAYRYHFNWLPSAAFPIKERDVVYECFSKARLAYIADTELYKDGVCISYSE